MGPTTPSTSTRNTRRTPERCLQSSPTRRQKEKRLNGVTPRRFARFWNRAAQQAPQSARSARQPLGDISYAGGNRQYAQSSPIKQSRRLLDQDEDGSNIFIDSSPDRPSPLKRVCTTHPRDSPAEIRYSSQELPSSPPAYPETPSLREYRPSPLQKSAFRRAYGSVMRREVDWPTHPIKTSKSGYCNSNWQSETANFYSNADDFHSMYNFETLNPATQTYTDLVVPFCVASCNTNSLAAVSDEEGYIRLVETAKDLSPPLDRHFLHFRAHRNAILDLAFSEDDLLLATASGDQTSQVIDMRTQKALFTLWGHKQTVRQVRFQPGSGGKVLSTAGRDGLIMIWDLRCSPSEHPRSKLTIDIGGGISTYDNEPNRKFAQWTHQFTPPVPRNKEGKLPAEKSVTTLSFLSSSSPHYLLSGSATSATVSLWDMRNMRLGAHSGQNALISTGSPSGSVKNSRGLTSLALSGDRSRLYALCKDSTIYSYSTAQLLNEGSSVEALYGLRHPSLLVSSFYASLAVRPAALHDDKSELLAVGSSDGNVLVFPTDEKYMQNEVFETKFDHKQELKMHSNGAVLTHGHCREVSSVTWTSKGELCTLSDDHKCRIWREDAQEARELRKQSGVNGGNTMLRGWSHVVDDFDEEE